MSPPPHAHFEQVYADHYAEVLRFVTRRAHPLNVDDVVSETFIAAWQRRDALPMPALPWLYRTARNVMLNSARGSGRRQALTMRIATHAPGTQTDDVEALERQLDLRAAFGTLSAADQEVLALHVWEDLDARSAAAAIGCSRATYSMRLTRARRRLAALLRETPAPVPASPLTLGTTP
ncbi:RNA polymerase sigma factor [Subtercola endophyticus]|uniref:RNA polymerase sigma factor n=1 Tax=Subtercola endophyticus TaxID=2895559 RepID=UPI001E4397C5|nr:sigma-70 family RNA polymerase sigma factor [Subtercola endophyticus]UFS60358.1 sigma-70 family RNA polymerase sigma factor [Subtercola endophyticus]